MKIPRKPSLPIEPKTRMCVETMVVDIENGYTVDDLTKSANDRFRRSPEDWDFYGYKNPIIEQEFKITHFEQEGWGDNMKAVFEGLATFDNPNYDRELKAYKKSLKHYPTKLAQYQADKLKYDAWKIEDDEKQNAQKKAELEKQILRMQKTYEKM